jgi:pyruvate dehydrogenase E2 component (dihydrolipoamide acetyltransferase)
MVQEVKLPEISENVDSGEVVRLLVSEGDTIAKDQSIMELETDKAAFEVPSTAAGKVVEIAAHAGDTVKVGQVLIKVESEEPGTEEAAEQKEEAEAEEGAEQPRREPPPAPPPPAPAAPEQAPTGEPPPASPWVRRLARELGVEIGRVQGSGPVGRISEEDVKRHVREAPRQPTAPGLELPDFSRWGEVEREPMSTVRRITARNTAAAWRTIPHVTQFDSADLTELEEFRRRYADRVAEAGGKLTVTAIILKVVAEALRAFPRFNSSLDTNRQEIIYKKYVHIGVAVDTDRGLLVPVVRNADKKGIVELAVELGQLAERARNKKIKPDELEGAGFTISNLGGIGGTGFSPVVYHPQVAILGVARARKEPALGPGGLRERTVLPLSLSYDHRVIDGADGARFLRWIAEALEQPLLLVFEGGL